jgi:hypothetical protein
MLDLTAIVTGSRDRLAPRPAPRQARTIRCRGPSQTAGVVLLHADHADDSQEIVAEVTRLAGIALIAVFLLYYALAPASHPKTALVSS